MRFTLSFNKQTSGIASQTWHPLSLPVNLIFEQLNVLELTFTPEVPFLLLTATCPPSLAPSLLESLAVHNCRIIRAPTNRPEISYNVHISRTTNQAQTLLVDAAKARLANSGPGFRCLVYCRSRATVETLAGLLGCKPYHSGVLESERDASFNNWVEGRECVLVSTSLLGCGIDVEGVEVVYHYLTPWSIMGFVQESGRAGRGGKPAESHIFASEVERGEEPGADDQFGREKMRDWVLQRSTCRRVMLGSFLDVRATTCILLPNANLCDICRQRMEEPHPRRPTELTSPPLTRSDVPKVTPLPPIPPSSAQYATERFRKPDTQM